MTRIQAHGHVRAVVVCASLVGVLVQVDLAQGIKGVRRVAILSGSSRAFYRSPSSSPSLQPSLFLGAGSTSRHGNNTAHYYRIVSDAAWIRHLAPRETCFGPFSDGEFLANFRETVFETLQSNHSVTGILFASQLLDSSFLWLISFSTFLVRFLSFFF